MLQANAFQTAMACTAASRRPIVRTKAMHETTRASMKRTWASNLDKIFCMAEIWSI